MILKPDAAERVEAAYDAAQLETRAPLVCVLAGASTSLDGEFLLGACVIALATPLPLLLFTNLSAHRIYVAQLLVAILAAVLVSLPPVRRWLTPKRQSASRPRTIPRSSRLGRRSCVCSRAPPPLWTGSFCSAPA